MATKRDQLHSYQFLVQRMVSALVTRESDPEQPPFRRWVGSAIGTVLIGALAVAIAWVYGLLVPGGNTSWQDGNVVIVEKETGTRFVYLDGRLHPTTNYASALLAVGQSAETVQVSQNSLAGVPRGPRIGIPDAPDALPKPERLLAGAWTMCSEPSFDEAGAPTSESVLMVGHQPPGGRKVGDGAMLVEVGPTKNGVREQYLIWRGYRHRVQSDDADVVGLALGAQPWAQVSPTFIDVLPAGEPVEPIELPDIGEPSRAIPDRPDTLVGQLFAVRTSNGVRYYLAETDALRPISEFQFDLQRSLPEVAEVYDGGSPYAIGISPAVAGSASLLPEDRTTEPSQLPQSKPEFVAPRTAEESACAVYQPGASAPELLVNPRMPEADPMTVTPRISPGRTVLADRVIVPPGQAAVVETMASETTPRGTVTVVTDLGRAYPLADPELLGVLGYGGVEPVRLPAWLVARVPHGSGLDPQAAMHQS